ncbi:tRNA pseudouridine(13) synthase TruD [Natrialbaceae archaeon A-CW2]|uniref:tRNA pseudouridine(13) synthase TruD n=1 Tax=Natronosalvus amylolyticus TaxID=2961994 RepID=UPI0020C96AA9|nr:tRNA pseudouridine(13) synthase TruD [Natronosalvus amylolyticus]
MRPAHPTEQAVGIEYYVTDTDGIGGRLRGQNDHFRVRELERFDTQPVDASTDAYPHLVFRATLRGWDTNDFARELSNRLGISRERIAWAGTKDKRAITTQLFSVYNTGSNDLPELNRADIELVGRAGRSLQFGDLLGNEFELIVSEYDEGAPERAERITDDLASFAGSEVATEQEGEARTIGVPNYFGQQRFGSKRPITHEVGLEIVRGNWDEAVMAYVGRPNESEPEDTQEARAFVEETRDWKAALERFPNRLQYERSMLHELADCDGEPSADEYRAALERTPSNLQRLFVHAAQSYVFNRILSRRLEAGLPFDKPVAGDVVCFADQAASSAVETDLGGLDVPDTDRLQRVDERRVRSVTRHCERGRAFVTAPLVGTETTLADEKPGDIEREVLADLGLEKGDFDLPGEFDSTGTRRAILLRTNLELETDPMTMGFALPKGSYATVVMREYLQSDPVALG